VVGVLKTKLNKNFYISLGITFYLFLFVCSLFFEVNTVLTVRSNHFDTQKVNLIPFNTLSEYASNFHKYNISTLLSNLIGNIFIYIPLGALLPFTFKTLTKFRHIFIVTFILSSSVEIFQYVTSLGILDIDDVILNLVGGLIGFYLYKKFHSRK